MANTDRFLPIKRQELAGSSLTTSYQIVGAVFPQPLSVLTITNNTNRDVDISLDGSTDHLVVLEGTSRTVQPGSNGQPIGRPKIPKGHGVQVKAASAGTGTLYVEGWYIP